MDAITVLREDHKRVERLFKQFEKMQDTATPAKKRDLVGEIVRELSVHAAVEEQAFYPAIRKAVSDVEDTVLESLEEHHIVKWTLDELDGMSGDEDRYDAKVTVLIESVRHHVEEEENEMFPQVRETMGRAALRDLAEVMENVRKVAPTHPHPKAPDEPPGNLVAGPAAALMDRAKDKVGIVGRRASRTGAKR